VRRKGGVDLTRNELKVLAAALRLLMDGAPDLYGYELFMCLRQWEGSAPMNHGTLYRGLRALEGRGYFVTSIEEVGERTRVRYVLTPDGVAAARHATIRLAALDRPPVWVDVRLAVNPLPGS